MLIDLNIGGFDWDDGNRKKCQKHGVTLAEIEQVFTATFAIDVDPSSTEQRYRAIGRTVHGRMLFLVFTFREYNGHRLIRPISARYMHRKEVQSYEEENPTVRE